MAWSAEFSEQAGEAGFDSRGRIKGQLWWRLSVAGKHGQVDPQSSLTTQLG